MIVNSSLAGATSFVCRFLNLPASVMHPSPNAAADDDFASSYSDASALANDDHHATRVPWKC